MSLPIAEVGFPTVISTATTTAVCPRNCQFLGFYVSSTTGGTVVVKDGTTAVSGTITPAIGYHRFPVEIGNSLNITTANTINMTTFHAA